MKKPKWVKQEPPTFNRLGASSEMIFTALVSPTGEVLALVSMFGAGYAAIVGGTRDGGYRTEGQAKSAAKKILKKHGVEV